MRNKFLLTAGMFFLLFVLFFPLGFLGDFQKKISLFIFGDVVQWIVNHIFNSKYVRVDFSSDSISMFILTIILLITSVLLTILIRKKYQREILGYTKEIIIVYLAVVLMKYGFDKIFKAQFYLPEPNILYSRFGNLDKDILFWSTMGTSRFFSISTGILELFTAVWFLLR
jgi:hypothetical protein